MANLTKIIEENKVKEKIDQLYINNQIDKQFFDIMLNVFDRLESYEKTLENCSNVPKKKFFIIEDGSIDLDDLENLKFTNPEIQVVVFRQGSRPPEILEMDRSKGVKNGN